jgi:hypothetical protein
VANAELVLYEYRSYEDVRAKKADKIVARTKADANGWFDFGSLPAGHYTLIVRGRNMADWVDVEIMPTGSQTDYVVFDISPNFPDCKGGHEFMVKRKV